MRGANDSEQDTETPERWAVIGGCAARTLSPGERVCFTPGRGLGTRVGPRGVSIVATDAGLSVEDRDRVGHVRWRGAPVRRRRLLTRAGVLAIGRVPVLLGPTPRFDRAPGSVAWMGMVARDPGGLEALIEIGRAALSRAPVWIHGETGTGKELVAHAIHAASARSTGPWVAVNCAALPDALAEAELFGVERGAFTGATHTREGAFRRAHGGTLLLDEIAELTPATQAKLLRALETGEVLPVGGAHPVRVDVRVLASTWRNLEVAARTEGFRRDLLHRLWVLRIDVPSLADRPGDIAPLLERMLAAEGALDLFPGRAILERLERERWPGNVRELRNHAVRTAVTGDPRQLLPGLGRLGPGQVLPRRTPRAPSEAIMQLIHDVLQRNHGNRSACARALGISRSTLYRWLRDGG